MATCKRCGKNVGCGCKLKEGLCPDCQAIVNKSEKK